MLKLFEPAVFGHWVWEVSIYKGQVEAKCEDHDDITRKRVTLFVYRTGDGQWSGPAGQLVNDTLIDKLEAAYQRLLDY